MRRDEGARGADVVERGRLHERSIGSIGAAIDEDRGSRALLRGLAQGRRCVFVAGLPASGKTRVVAELAQAAALAGRTVHTLQWDVARLPFDTPAILARYAEVHGVTHAAIRLAVGAWVRDAVTRWHHGHPDERDVLIGETPLAGERFMSLARPRADEAEALLASDATCFIVPVPTAEVRAAIEEARAGDFTHARDAKSAPPDLVAAHWRDLARLAVELGVPGAREGTSYDPDVYAATYRRLLRHRHVIVVPIAEVARASDAIPIGTPLVPGADEVDAAMRAVERLSAAEIERRVRAWHRA